MRAASCQSMLAKYLASRSPSPARNRRCGARTSTSRSQTMTSDGRAGTARWYPETRIADLAEPYASTEAAVPMHQLGRPASRDTFFTRSLTTPLPTPTRRSGASDRTSAVSSAASSTVGTGGGSPGRIREVMLAVRVPRFQRSPAAASVRSSLRTHSDAPAPWFRRRVRAEDSSAPSPRITSTGERRCTLPQGHRSPAKRAFSSSRNGCEGSTAGAHYYSFPDVPRLPSADLLLALELGNERQHTRSAQLGTGQRPGASFGRQRRRAFHPGVHRVAGKEFDADAGGRALRRAWSLVERQRQAAPEGRLDQVEEGGGASQRHGPGGFHNPHLCPSHRTLGAPGSLQHVGARAVGLDEIIGEPRVEAGGQHRARCKVDQLQGLGLEQGVGEPLRSLAGATVAAQRRLDLHDARSSAREELQ